MEHKPGEAVLVSGIYRVVHDKNHAAEHDITAVKGEKFPPCRGCGAGVRFKIRYAADHLSDHDHFKK